MKTDRRTFIGGAIAAAATAGWGVRPPELHGDGTGRIRRVMLELGGLYSAVGSPLSGSGERRWTCVDLADEDDAGDIGVFLSGPGLAWGLGNDEEGYRRIERVFEADWATDGVSADGVRIIRELSFGELSALLAGANPQGEEIRVVGVG